MDDQHFATHADLERVRADLIERIAQLEVRMVERMAQLEVRLIEPMAGLEVSRLARSAQSKGSAEQAGKRMACWMAGLFTAQTFVLVGTVLGMIEVLR